MRTKAMRTGFAMHWEVCHLLGGHLPQFTDTLNAAAIVGMATTTDLGEQLRLANWAKHAPPPGLATLPQGVPVGACMVYELEGFRDQLFRHAEGPDHHEECGDEVETTKAADTGLEQRTDDGEEDRAEEEAVGQVRGLDRKLCNHNSSRRRRRMRRRQAKEQARLVSWKCSAAVRAVGNDDDPADIHLSSATSSSRPAATEVPKPGARPEAAATEQAEAELHQLRRLAEQGSAIARFALKQKASETHVS